MSPVFAALSRISWPSLLAVVFVLFALASTLAGFLAEEWPPMAAGGVFALISITLAILSFRESSA